jgi:hypothetical protein
MSEMINSIEFEFNAVTIIELLVRFYPVIGWNSSIMFPSYE